MSTNRRNRRHPPIVIRPNDVLNGRGVKIAQHPGNLRFRSLVKTSYDESYCVEFTSSEKRALAREIINHIKEVGGRFLKQPHGSEGPWIELTEGEIERKTKQALRDCNRSDRNGYAEQVAPPEDVQRADQERKESGLTLQEHARKKVSEETIRSNRRVSNNSRNTPPTSGAVSRTSRRNNQSDSTPADALVSAPGITISQQPVQEYSDFSFEPSLTAVSSEASSANGWPAQAATATPATRPYTETVPVTQTPNPHHPSFFDGSGQGHHLVSQSGSHAPSINPHSAVSYHEGYGRRDAFEHHLPAAQVVSSIGRGFASPVLRSPIVTQSTANAHVFEQEHEPLTDDFYAGHNPRQMFQDPLDTLAASTSESQPVVDEDFILAFDTTNEVNMNEHNITF